MNQKSGCIFCRNDFPNPDELVSKAPKYWLFIHNRNPHTNYHCLVVLKSEVFSRGDIEHVDSISDSQLKDDILQELGIVLNRASAAIKACSSDIDRVLISSLNTGEGSSHLHFHLVPKRKDEKVMTVHEPDRKGGGMFFMARKEIVADTFEDYIKSTCCCSSDRLLSEIKKAREENIIRNTLLLREKFVWEEDKKN